MSTPQWTKIEAMLREDAYASITSQPEFLFEHDGGPYGIKADLIYARLIGFDDQIVADWRIQHIEPDLRMPIYQPITLDDDDAPPSPNLKTAKYVLQSGWATLAISPLYCDDCPVKPQPPDFLVRLLFLRYRRRS